jgi:hypothetical protein
MVVDSPVLGLAAVGRDAAGKQHLAHTMDPRSLQHVKCAHGVGAKSRGRIGVGRYREHPTEMVYDRRRVILHDRFDLTGVA